MPPILTWTPSGRVLLHHRHVLVGRGVEDDRRLGVGDQAVHDRAARDVREVDRQLSLAAAVELPKLQLALDHVQRALGPIDQDEAARSEA